MSKKLRKRKMLTANKIRLNMFILVLLAFSGQIGLAIITPSLPEMSKSLSVSMFSVMGFFIVGMGIGQIFWGLHSDIIGRKVLMVVGVMLFASTSILITITSHPAIIIILRLLQGFSTGSMFSISQAIIADQNHTNENMVSSIAVSDFGFGFAWILLPLLGGFIAFLNNWKLNFYIMSIFTFIVAVLCVLLLTESRESKFLYQRNTKQGYKFFISMYKNPQYMVIPLLIAIPNSFFAAFNTSAPMILEKSLHIPTFLIGIISSMLGAAYTIAIFFNIGFLNKKKSVNIVNIMTFLFLISTIFQLIFAGFNILNIYTLYLPMSFNIIIWGIMFPHILASALIIYKNDGGTVGSHLGFTFYILAGIGTYLFGKVFDNNFLGISEFTFIMAIITIILVAYFNLVNKQTLNKTNENILFQASS